MTVHINAAPNTKAQALRDLQAKGFAVSSLLAKPEANPKLAKNMKVGVISAPLHLAPADLSGYEVCPMATQGCRKACLHTAGNPVAMEGKERSRILKTKAYYEARREFMALLVHEIDALQRKARKAGTVCGVRLNATSDIPWERVNFVWNGVPFRNLMERFPEVQFYDYTKRHNRRDLPSNYHLTYSLAEGNDATALEALQNGMNVAAVFDTKRGHDLPPGMVWDGEELKAAWGSYPIRVIDGDEHDYRPADPRGVVVGLRAKGDAIGDTSGFVRAAA